MRAAAIVVCLMLVIGCGGRDRAEQQGQDLPEACDTALREADSGQIASIAPFGNDTRTPATSWVRYEDIYELAWASHQIVRGQVIEDCGTVDDSGGRTSPDWTKRMLVRIDAVYRGTPRETILVPASSDDFSNDRALTFAIGNDVILFLDANGYPVGGPQGHWRVMNGRAVPFAGQFPELPLNTFARALAASLHQSPPAQRDFFPSLDRAPAGPALPIDRKPPRACDGIVPPNGETVEAAGDLVWISKRIVIGTVSDVRPSTFPRDTLISVDRSLRVPVTDYVIQVEQHLRGTPVESLTLRQLGGTVEDCTVGVFGAPELSAGDRLLLFLSPLDEGHIAYVTSAGQHGLWRIGGGGALAENTRWQSYPQVVPVADLVGMVADTLAGEMPLDQWIEHDPVPLGAAPLGDTIWPDLPRPDGWTTYDDPDGRLSLEHPSGWTQLPEAEAGAMMLASWAADGPTAPIPAGEARIELRQIPTTSVINDPAGVPAAAGAQIASLYFDSSRWPLDPEPPAQVHRIVARFQHADVAWEIVAAFGTQPSSDDPATLEFYTLLRSIRHPAS